MAMYGNRDAREASHVRGSLTARGLLVLLLSAASSSPVAASGGEWQTTSNKGGIRVESRRIPGERYDEIRIGTSLEAAPAVVADYLFGKYLDEKNRNIRRSFIQRGPALTIWSDVIRAPMAGERCYSMRFERRERATGEIRVKFASLDPASTSPPPDCIALRSRGEWIMTPEGPGTRLSYISLTDIGGKLPAAFARRSLSSAAVLSVRKVVAGSSGLPLPKGIGD